MLTARRSSGNVVTDFGPRVIDKTEIKMRVQVPFPQKIKVWFAKRTVISQLNFILYVPDCHI